MEQICFTLLRATGDESLFLFFLIVLRFVLAYGVGCLGKNRKIGFGWAFALALIHVLLGLIIVLCSKKEKEFIDIE